MTARHVPLRTCVQCRSVRPKRELVRIVRSPQGAIAIDEKGKAAGRGAYLCRNADCWEMALATARLDHALKAKLTAEDKAALREYGQQWPARDRTSDEKGDGAAEAVEG